MKILVTGFEPFNGRDINPSQLILEQLETPEGVTLIKEVLPVEFKATTERLKNVLKEHQPDVVLSLGQAGNRPEICVERVAINLDNVRSANGKRELPDNAGDTPVDVPIVTGAPNAYFSTLPVWDMVKEIQDVGVEAAVSYTAGTYVCNHVMYTVLHETAINYPETKAGFVHVPFLPEQNPTTGYTMELEDMIKGIQVILEYFKNNP
ncbi:MAG: pyroglutamyl-peptidase I [Agathobacter sp.]|nr:pyroglutamyl-peptidase I [Agathobacter sp.]